MEGSGGRRTGVAYFRLSSRVRSWAKIVSGEKTLAELSRELEIQPAVLRNWMRLVERGNGGGGRGRGGGLGQPRVRELEQQVKELQRLVGKQAMTIEILEAARDLGKKKGTLLNRVWKVV